MTGFLFQALVYLTAAVLCVPLARRLGMSSVLGYLTAGVIIGPFVLGFVGREGSDVMHAAEFGVVMMLFLIGLEIEPTAFWRMRRTVLGAGTMQLVVTAAAIAALSTLAGIGWRAAVAVGLAAAMSSTAIALQSLKEKGEMGTAAGQHSFAVLLFQDIAVIPILALLPLLAGGAAVASASHEGALAHYPGWMRTLAVAGAIAAVVIAGRFLIVPFLRVVARTRLRELFTASALMIVVAITLLMQTVGLSPALGTFLAGLILATSEFKHELESDLDPFKGLLLGLFFIAVGASIDFRLIAANPLRIFLITLLLVIIKAAILFGVGRWRGLSLAPTFTFALGLSQVGEFAFVLIAFAQQLGIVPGTVSGTLTAVVALSMASTPLLMLFHERVLQRMGVERKQEREEDVIEERHRVIIAGFSHFGSTVGRLLRANGVEATILDNDSDRVDLLRRMGFKVYYGDATRADLLESAGAREAQILVSAIDGVAAQQALIRTVSKHFPHLELLIRSRHRFDAYELMELGRGRIYREHLDTSVRVGVDVLRSLGFRAYTAYRAGQQFLRYDEEAMARLATVRHDSRRYIDEAREQIARQEELLQADLQHDPTSSDHAWDSEELRRGLQAPAPPPRPA